MNSILYSALVFVIALSVWALVVSLYYSTKTAPPPVSNNPFVYGQWDLNQVKPIIESSPSVILHHEIFQSNTKKLFEKLEGKHVRIATKSIRVPEIIHEIWNYTTLEPRLMCYNVEEAQFLYEWSIEKYQQAWPNSTAKTSIRDQDGRFSNEKRFIFKDILVAYPTMNKESIITAFKMTQQKVKISLVVDCDEHINFIASTLKEYLSSTSEYRLPPNMDKTENGAPTSSTPSFEPIALCIDVDCSLNYLGNRIHIGANRSPIRTIRDLEHLTSLINGNYHFVYVAGVMTYEAQVAGVGDASTYNSTIYNTILRLMKGISSRYIQQFRCDISRSLRNNAIKVSYFNGGGSGNFGEACRSSVLTEVTAGSAFFQPRLFDFFDANFCDPSVAISLQITRIPSYYEDRHDQNSKCKRRHPAVICCQSGGFAASGASGPDKSPDIFLPKGLLPFYENEGFGEVQTPMMVQNETFKCTASTEQRDENASKSSDLDCNFPQLGDHILIRPAKSGEVMERFDEILVFRSDHPTSPKRLKTYRGYGKSFY